MSVNTVALIFDIWAVFLVAVVVGMFMFTKYKLRSRLSLEQHLLKHERYSIVSNDDKTFWTLQQYDNIGGKAWYAMLEHDAAGVLRGWSGYRRELEALARILNVTPLELTPTTAEDFFIRTNISALRPIARKR